MLLACFGGREKDNEFQNDVREFFFIFHKKIFLKI